MTAKQWEARAEALRECAEHLDQCWTEDKDEREQGRIVADELRKRADHCSAIAALGLRTNLAAPIA